MARRTPTSTPAARMARASRSTPSRVAAIFGPAAKSAATASRPPTSCGLSSFSTPSHSDTLDTLMSPAKARCCASPVRVALATAEALGGTPGLLARFGGGGGRVDAVTEMLVGCKLLGREQLLGGQVRGEVDPAQLRAQCGRPKRLFAQFRFRTFGREQCFQFLFGNKHILSPRQRLLLHPPKQVFDS